MQSENLQKAHKIISERNQIAKATAKMHYDEIINKIPRAKEIYYELASTSLKISKVIFSKQSRQEDVNILIEKLKSDNISLQNELNSLIVQNGYPENYLETVYFCDNCEDSGFIGGKRCHCLEELATEIAVKQFNSTVEMSGETFDNFSLKYYSDVIDERSGMPPKRIMSDILDFCKQYVNIFTKQAPNVLMLGDTGLGKTHLSLAIANDITKKGYTTVYSSAPDLFRLLQNEYFGKTAVNADTIQTVLDSDLVIIDDLGAEFESAFNSSCLYNIVNTRLNMSKPTIINTNLTPQEIERRYTNRVASRLLTMYKCLKFVGRDVREIKLRNNEI